MHSSFILVPISLFLVGCSAVSPPRGDVTSPSSEPVESFEVTLERASAKIKDTPEFEACMQPSVNMCITQVGNQLALEKNSPEFCREIEDIAAQEACVYGVVLTEISKTQDITLCDGLSENFRDECHISAHIMESRESGKMSSCDAIEKLSSSGSSNLLYRDRADQCRADLVMKDEQAKKEDCDILRAGPVRDMCRAFLTNRELQAQ